MKILKASKERTKEDRSALRKTVGDIIENVIENGDAALLEYNHRFDGCDRASLRISKEEIEAAYKEVPEEDIEDIKKAAANIKAFAQAQRKTMMGTERLFSCKRHHAGTPDHPGGFLLLLCSGRRISALFHGAHAGDPCKGSRCKARYSLLPGHKRHGAHPPEDTGRYGYRRY